MGRFHTLAGASPLLLPRKELLRTGPIDKADWNYRPVLGTIQRKRFGLVLEVLGPRKYESMLEIGYGSGIFMPELARLSSHLTGLDIHDFAGDVAAHLARFGVSADLAKGSADHMPFPDDSFDAIVSVSAIEFTPDLAAAASEVFRVLKPGGVAAMVFPNMSRLVDLGLKVLTGEGAAQGYRSESGTDRRIVVLRELLARFRIERQLRWPRRPLPKVYTCLKLVKA